MTVWIVIIGVLVSAFVIKAVVTLRHRKRHTGSTLDLSTRNRLKKCISRFRHLEGIGG